MRRMIVKLHRWIGIALGIYVAMICLTGSVLVYRPELYRHFEPQPVAVETGVRLLSDRELMDAARRAFPSRQPTQLWRGRAPNHAVEVELTHEDDKRGELFDPYTGAALGPALPLGFRATSALIELHTELLGGPSGRVVNGAFGLFFVFLGLTGVLAWRPQKRRSRTPEKPVARARGWSLRRWHTTIGIWAAVFVLMWSITGVHLVFPAILDTIVEYFDPFDEMNPVERLGDKISYWLAYAHFGRFGYFPWCSPGLCGESLKAVWALVALVPAFLAISGLVMWVRGLRAKARVRRGGTELRS